MGYGPDVERNLKLWNNNTSFFISNDADLLVNTANPTGLMSVALHPDVKREGGATDFVIKDHLNSNRLTLRHGGTTPSLHAYSPYGQPSTTYGNILAGGSNAPIAGGKGNLNERVACPREGGGPRNRVTIRLNWNLAKRPIVTS
jgi:hypothetical protein